MKRPAPPKLKLIRAPPRHHLPLLTRHNLRELLFRHRGLRNLQRPLDGLSPEDPIMPLLHRRPVRQIEAEEVRRDPRPRKAGYVCNGEFLAGQVGRFLETGFQDGIQSLCLVRVSLDAPVGADRGESREVVGLSCLS